MFHWMAVYPVTCALLLVVLFCLLQSWLLKKDFFSPVTVYCFSQCITLAIAYLQIDAFMSDFKPLTWMVWILGLVAFCSGCYVAKLSAKARSLPVRVVEATPPQGYNWRLHLVISFFLFALFLVGVVKIIAVAGNLIIFTENPGRWMSKDVSYGYFPLLFSSGPLCVLMFGVAAFKKFNDVVWVRRVSFVMVLVVIVVNLLAYPNRTALFFNLGFLMILINYLYKRISPLIILIAMAVAILSFVAISNLRNQYGTKGVEDKALEVLVVLPYKYVANNYWNMDYAINPPNDDEYHPHTYGLDFLSGFLEFFRIPGSFRNSFGWDDAFNESIQKEYGFNTVNYLWDVYKDFHLLGVLFFPFLCGIGLTVLHLKLCRPFTPRQVMFHVFFIYFVGWWFFTSGYKQSIYCMWGVAIYLVTTICSRPVELSQEGAEPAGQSPAGLADATADTGDARECGAECLPADAPLEGEVECERDGKEDVAR